MLHELEPRIGILDVKMRNDIPCYESSDSRLEMERFKEFFAALGYLRQATEASELETFECTKLIEEAIADISIEIDIDISGPANSVFKADKGQLRMAILNGLRNAVESTLLASKHRRPDNIVIAWGETDADYWIAIIDDGVGIGKLTDKAVRIGNTTKSGHFGMGLTIAQQAIQTLNGKMSVSSPNTTGAVFELRWYK